MIIALSYSRNHFDPESVDVDHFNPTSGAAYLAHSLYMAIKRVFPNSKVLYYDYTEHETIRLQHVNLFLGIEPNFAEFVKKLSPDISLKIRVNRHEITRMHTYYHNRCSLTRRSIPLTPHDLQFYNQKEILTPNNLVFHLQLGGYPNFVANHYAGINKSRQVLVNFRMRKVFKPYDLQEQNNIILLFMGNVCYRKGLYLLHSLLKLNLKNNSKWRLLLIGKSDESKVLKYVELILRKFPGRFEYLNTYINFESQEWKNLRSQIALALFPSIEEGQQEAVFAIIAEGIPSLYSQDCGFDLYDPLTLISSNKSFDWFRAIENFLRLPSQIRMSCLEIQQAYARSIDSSDQIFQTVLSRLFQKSSPSIWPTLAVDSSDKKLHARVSIPYFLRSKDLPPDYLLKEIKRSDAACPYLFSQSSNISFTDKILMGILFLESRTSIKQVIIEDIAPEKSLVIARCLQNSTFPENSSISIANFGYNLGLGNWSRAQAILPFVNYWFQIKSKGTHLALLLNHLYRASRIRIAYILQSLFDR